MAQQHNDYTNYEELAETLRGLGLARLGATASALKRYRKHQRERYNATAELLQELNCKLLKQTPSNHIYQCNRDGELVSCYAESETRILAAPLDLAEVHRLWNPNGLCDTDGTNVNRRLYKLLKKGRLALRTDLTRAGGEAIPPCSHLVYMDSRKREAYFLGRDGQTEKLAAALFPFVNLMRRTRHTGTLPQDFGCADSLKLLRELSAKLEHQLARLAKHDTAKEKKAVVEGGGGSGGEEEKSQKKVEAMQQLHAMSQKHKEREHRKKKEKRAKKQHREEGKSKKRRADDEPLEAAEPEPQKKQKVQAEPAQPQPQLPQGRPWPRLIINPPSPVVSVSASPARSSDDSEMTEEVVPKLQHQIDIDRDLAWFAQHPVINAV